MHKIIPNIFRLPVEYNDPLLYFSSSVPSRSQQSLIMQSGRKLCGFLQEVPRELRAYLKKYILTYLLLCRSIKIGYSVNCENPIDTNFNNRLYFSTIFLFPLSIHNNKKCYELSVLLLLGQDHIEINISFT